MNRTPWGRERKLSAELSRRPEEIETDLVRHTTPELKRTGHWPVGTEIAHEIPRLRSTSQGQHGILLRDIVA